MNQDISKINAALVNYSCYITGTLQKDNVKRITTNEVEFY